MSAPLIEARGIGKRYRRSAFGRGICLPDFSRVFRRVKRNQPPDDFWALKDIDLELKQGDSLGIIGPNGAGKSTLLKILSRVTDPTEGVLKIRGRVGALIEVGAGFHPELSGRDNIYINGAILGMSRREVQKRFDEIVDFADIEDFIDTPVKKYSSGMYVRLGFAVAAHMDPDILLIDEVLAVGDGRFQQKCFQAMARFRDDGVPFVLVSHSMYNITRNCSTALFLRGGCVRNYGATDHVIASYQKYAQNPDGTLARGTDPHEHQYTRDVRIVRARVEDMQRMPVSAIETGDSIVLDVQYEVLGSCSQINLEVAVHQGSEDVIAVNSTYLDGHPVCCSDRQGRVQVCLPRFPFTSGHYEFDVSIMDDTSRIRYDRWRGFHRDELCLEVRPNNKSASFERFRGIVDLECDWQLGTSHS